MLFVVPQNLPHQTTTPSLNSTPSSQSCDTAYKYSSVCGIDTHCAVPIEYTDSLCQSELSSLKLCLENDIDEGSHPLVVTDSDIETAKMALSFVDDWASEACAAEVKPFLCLYFFGLCDSSSGVSYQPTASNCKNLRDNICTTEWSLASRFIDLPDCDVVFSDDTVPCDANNEEDGKKNITD